MIFRASNLVLLSLFTVNVGIAQQTEISTQDLQLNLEQFPDTQLSPQKEQLELNLEQFETENSGSPGSDDSLELNPELNPELNLEQFDNSSQSGANIGSTNSKAIGNEKSNSSSYNYKRIFLIGGALTLIFLYVLSRRRKRRR